ncbi:MAG TPA: SDR family oxidoreductase [Gammaproteobacteria bacterium]|nr:SDR family oxidoreductase [Gammaproteobacteria bacterium]
MKISGNTLLITGGTSGIGRALAEAFHAEGNQVIVAGRRQALLDEVTKANPGMKSVVLDVEDAAAIRRSAAKLLEDFPALNGVIHNAGIMRSETLAKGELADAEAIIATNLLGPIRLTAALLPALLKQQQATIITVTSGLAFVPLALTPSYNASKAAIHSYTQAMRYQLKDTSVQVIELVPPYVQTDLQGPRQAADPTAMPLKDFIAEAMDLLRSSPDAAEILVERVKAQRFAEASGSYDAFFRMMNERVIAARKDWH